MSARKVKRLIQATASEVYHYFTSSTALRDWMCDVATADPQPGGRLYLCWPGEYYTSGEYLQLEANKFISFSWFGREEPHPTQVDITLKEQKGGTLVKLAHRGMGKSEKWKKIADTYENEWEKSLENLASVVESGPDLRITRRPLIGIYLSDFNAEIATRLKVPVNYGLRLDGVIDGLGAQKAGLVADDVIVEVDEQPLLTAGTFGSIIKSKNAGDTVKLTFFRGGEKKTVKMTLSGRPIPPIPLSPFELVKQVEPGYRKYESEIESIIEPASEEECSYKPDPSEWSAKEVLAHLIHSEIGWQNAATEIILGTEGSYDEYSSNFQPRIDGTTTAFPSKNDLLMELKAHDAETLSMLAHIPEDFTSHKGRFWKLVYQAAQNPIHIESHLDQMRSAISMAKKA